VLIEFRKAFNRIETKVAITLGLILSFLCLLESTRNINPCFPLSSFQSAMVYNGKIAELFSTILLPIIAVVPYTDCFYCEKKYGVNIFGLLRTGQIRYFFSKAIVVSVISFLVILIPYLSNQIYCIMAFQLENLSFIISGTVYDKKVLLPELSLNYPAIRNLLHVLFACFYGSGIGLLGFSISLFIYKNRVFANILPVAVCFAWIFFAFALLGNDYVPPLGIIMELNQPIQSYIPMITVVSFCYAICIVSIFIKCKRDLY
jgi:hypothetical protein